MPTIGTITYLSENLASRLQTGWRIQMPALTNSLGTQCSLQAAMFLGPNYLPDASKHLCSGTKWVKTRVDVSLPNTEQQYAQWHNWDRPLTHLLPSARNGRSFPLVQNNSRKVDGCATHDGWKRRQHQWHALQSTAHEFAGCIQRTTDDLPWGVPPICTGGLGLVNHDPWQ